MQKLTRFVLNLPRTIAEKTQEKNVGNHHVWVLKILRKNCKYIKPLHILVIPAVLITSQVASLIGSQLAEERSRP
jgi:hypothetical protein